MISIPTPLENIPSCVLLGLRFMISSSASSVPKAKAGKQSVTRLIHNKCTGSKISKPNKVAMKIHNTSLKLDPSKNCIALRILS